MFFLKILPHTIKTKKTTLAHQWGVVYTTTPERGRGDRGGDWDETEMGQG